MTYSDDCHWRAVALVHVYGMPIEHVVLLLVPKERTIRRSYALFLERGTVNEHSERERKVRWPANVLASVTKYVQEHSTFYIEELGEYIIEQFPTLSNVSASTLCRCLNFNLNFSRKVLEKAAREAIPAEIQVYRQKLVPLYSNPEKLVFSRRDSKGRTSCLLTVRMVEKKYMSSCQVAIPTWQTSIGAGGTRRSWVLWMGMDGRNFYL
ncbi:hypothetical protein L915_17933 [Phytophthora nicotianae]|uniref:Uncharacterized protein n=1 Tax=Phytophthora nicotianae TaxID=4792 RepID=W2FXD0_PHYNI|nr:hypothetical protein L915_17933 [Phytophthora nicotianae]